LPETTFATFLTLDPCKVKPDIDAGLQCRSVNGLW
jgi:hypothetical protein